MKRSELRKIALVVVVFAIAGGVWALTAGSRSDEPMKYFYDLSEKKLFTAPRDAFAPIKGVGGEPDDGVEAVVVRCPLCDPEQQRVAYLTTHTPEYKQKREAARQADERIPGLTREWIADNTLVRLVDGDEWYVATSPEGVKIVSGWKRRCAEHGKWEKPCMP
jgi:hypothetical protein